MSHLPQALSEADHASLVRAYEHLEYPSFAARLSSAVGTPIEKTIKLLPRRWYRSVQRCAESGICKALDVAITNVQHKAGVWSDDRRYRLLGMVSGAIGGFFGGPAMLLELPVTTTIMLSSIADIARCHGEDLNSLETRMACMEVFALGGRSHCDDAAETGYYGLRMALELPIASASRFLAQQGTGARTNAPVLINLVASLAERFGVVLSQKAAAEIIPLIGAAGGAFINSVFIHHFQDVARSHFTIRRLERKYSPELIKVSYERIRQKQMALQYGRLVPAGRRLPRVSTVAA